jgi:predicted TIM-barrel fold metal-dependent hydrolase
MPGVEPSSLEICMAANDELYRAVENNKSRYVGFAMLPMNGPPTTAAELERCVQELGFVGTLVSNHAYGRYYDDEYFWPVLSTAQKLDVPIYLHLTSAAVEKRPDFDGNCPPEFAAVLSAHGWGWHSDTGLHFLKLYGAGVFERFPQLKIIIRHIGEMLLFMLGRIERFSVNWVTICQRKIRTVWDENVWATTSGMFYLAPFAYLIRAVKMERGREFVEEIEMSGMVTGEQLAMMAYRNAVELLKIRVQYEGQKSEGTADRFSKVSLQEARDVACAIKA